METISPAIGLGAVSQWCLAVAIVPLRAKTSFLSLVEAGWRPILLIVLETLWIGGIVLAAIVYAR